MIVKHKIKRLVSFLLTLLIAAVIPFSFSASAGGESAGGTTYYISSSDGNDENSGTSESSPWKTLSKLSGLTLTAGDRVLLKSGDLWVESAEIYAPCGKPENPVIIGSYGEGEKPQLRLFEDTVEKYADTPVLYIEDAEWLEIDGLDIGFCGVGINLHYDNTYNKEHVKIKNTHFHDIYGFYQLDRADITLFPHAAGIIVTRSMAIPGYEQPALKGLYIENCTSYDAGSLYTYGGAIGGSYPAVEGLYVTDCVMENNGIYGIAIANNIGGYMDNCKIIDCGSRYAPMGSMGIMISCEGFTIMNSEIAFQQRLEDNPDGGGIDFEHLTYDVDIINCYIHDNSGVGTMFFNSGADETHQNKRIRYISNVFENNNQNVSNVGGAELISIPLYSLVDGAIINNRYMESENPLTMYMDASVEIAGNRSYSKELQGKVWPILDFDDVRDYVINGKPLPLPDDEDLSVSTFDIRQYLIGVICGFGVVIIAAAAVIIIRTIKKRRVRK